MRASVPRIVGICSLLGGLAIGPLAHTGTAMASGPQLALSPASAAPGAPITIGGTGFQPFGTVTLYWDGNQIAALPVSPDGTFAYQNSIAPWAPAGLRSVVAQDTGGGQASATFTVLALSRPALIPPPAPAPLPSAPAPPGANPVPSQGIPTSGTTGNGCQITPDQAAAEQNVLSLLNQDRAAAGAPPLTLNETLSLASRQHSCDMFERQQLNHDGSDGSSPFQRMSAVGVAYSMAGENIGMAGGMDLSSGVNAIDSEMMAEPLTYGDHHWNIVNPAYTQVGIGVIYANNQVWLTEDYVG